MKKFILKIKNIVNSVLFDYNSNIPLFWFKGKNNFGDEINIFIVEKLSQKNVKHIIPKYFLNKHYFCIGSILERAQSSSVIWGSGFISKDSKVIKPYKIHAVRGPKTRKVFLENNIECPAVYGDPALLLPMFYTPSFDKKYKIGVIPHYVDKNLATSLDIFKNSNINIIDIQQLDYMKFIEELSQCELIISSSLHGLIVSDAYGIDNIWIKFSKKIVGNDFKFFDYFESIGRINEKVCLVDTSSSINDILEYQNNYKINIDLDKLLESCPFYNYSK